MKISVQYIYKDQPVLIRGSGVATYFRNLQFMNYWNDKLNGKIIFGKSNEQLEGERGDY